MANHQVAQAVSDEVDLRNAVEPFDDMGEALGVIGHFGPGAGVAELEDREIALGREILFHAMRGGAGAAQPVQQDHDFALHRRQFLLAANLIELVAALGERAPGAANVGAVEQAIGCREHIALDSPIAK